MATEGNGGLGSSEEVREGQLMAPTLESLAASVTEDGTQNTIPWLETNIRRLVCDAFAHLMNSSPAMVGERLGGSLQSNRMATSENGGFCFEIRFGGSLQLNRMATRENGVLGSSEEVREGQQMDRFWMHVANGRMEDVMQSLLPLLEPQIHRPVCDAFAHLMNSGPAMLGGREQIQELDRRNLQLRFQSSLPLSFFTGKKVEGLCVNLIDTSTSHVVASGPLSSLKLDVVVLEGDFGNKDDDWTQEIFESHVVKQRTGKPPLLTGDLQVSLKEGKGSLGELKFTDNSSWMRSGEFRLGVKVASGLCEGIRVREGKTDAFKVKERRGESYRKHDQPTLDDDVWRLKNIAKNGAFHKKLNKVEIFKVRHFLWKLGTDDQELKKILGSNMSDRMWETLVEHAKNCNPSGKYYVYYADKTKNSGVVFKMIYELCGLIEREKYYSAENLSDRQKVLADNLKKEACAKWKDIVEYDGLPPLEMNPSKRARISETDVVTFAPESCPSDIDLASLSYVDPPVNPGQDIGAPVPCQPPSVPSGEASKSSMPDSEGADLIVAMLDDVLDLPSLPRDPLAQADENSVCSSGLDTFGREDDQSDSHLLPSSLDLLEQANGRKEVWEWGGNGEDAFEDLDLDLRRFMEMEVGSSQGEHFLSGSYSHGEDAFEDLHFLYHGYSQEDAGGESSVEEEDSSCDSDNEKSAPSSLKSSCRGKPTERKKKMSAAADVIGGATAIWVLFQLLEYHLTPVCYGLILFLAIHTFIKKSPPRIPEINIPEDTVVSIALAIRFEINRAFAVLRENASGRDFPKFLAGLWVLSIVGTRCNFFTLFYIAFVALHTVRVQYEDYEDQIDSFAEKAMAEFKKQWAVFDARVLSKIPRGTIYNRA